jgi:two-component system, chemotaxis family, chemotaxis protein CheY
MKSLVVEDDLLSRMLLLSILSRFGQCDSVENGAEAVSFVEKAINIGKPYDVMCLDIIMPVLGGQEALLQIRKMENRLGIKEPHCLKVIMVTAIEDFDNITRAFEGGHCEAYLTKPVKEDELIEHLHELDLIEHNFPHKSGG